MYLAIASNETYLSQVIAMQLPSAIIYYWVPAIFRSFGSALMPIG
jgi:hypothetical protein